MSIILLIDGYNVIAPVAAPGRGGTTRWLETERQRLLDRLVKHIESSVLERTCVVFDAKDAPRNQPSRYNYHGIDVCFAVDHPEADDLLEELIRVHPTPKSLTVVSSDHRIQAAAKRRRCGRYDAGEWLDDLLDGKLRLTKRPRIKAKESPNAGRSQDHNESPAPASIELPEDPISSIDDEQLKDWMEGYL